MRNEDKTMEKIVALAFNRGFVIRSDIYGGLANAWDYGVRGRSEKCHQRRLVETLCCHLPS